MPTKLLVSNMFVFVPVGYGQANEKSWAGYGQAWQKFRTEVCFEPSAMNIA
jgi:hypothetical protein